MKLSHCATRVRFPSRAVHSGRTFCFAGLALCFSLRGASAAPDAGADAWQDKVEPRALVYLDKVAATYKKLRSLSVQWAMSGGPGQPVTSRGTYAWRVLKAVGKRGAEVHQVRFEDHTHKDLIVSNGKLSYFRARYQHEPIYVRKLRPGQVGALTGIRTDEVTPFLLAGRNPLRQLENSSYGQYMTVGRDPFYGGARLLGSVLISGVRCRGVQFSDFITTRDRDYRKIYTLWFDKNNHLRRLQLTDFNGEPQRSMVDFALKLNPKLPTSLFALPANAPAPEE